MDKEKIIIPGKVKNLPNFEKIETRPIIINYLDDPIKESDTKTKLDNFLMFIQKNKLFPITIDNNIVDVRNTENILQSEIDYIKSLGYDIIYKD